MFKVETGNIRLKMTTFFLIKEVVKFGITQHAV